mmetsp:Transcript_100655/g.290793  ORF Transcript_100655/g.290793 Transcript_100655/m.290793 type:complete len:225 (+) Transcript_100655:494-1168(+)
MRGTCVYLSMKTSAFGTSRSPKCTTLSPTQLPTSLCTLCRMAFINLDTRGADCSRLRPWPVSQSRYRKAGSKRSSSVACQSANMLPMISRQSSKLCKTKVYCVRWLCDRQEPPRPRLISRLHSRSSLGLNRDRRKSIIRSHGSRLNRWKARWSLMEETMVSMLSSVRKLVLSCFPLSSSLRSPACLGTGVPVGDCSVYFFLSSANASFFSITSAATSALVLFPS